MRDRLIELLFPAIADLIENLKGVEDFADYLLESDVIVPPCDTVWFIVDKNTKYAMAMPRQTDELPLYMLRDLNKYGYYKTKEEAEQVLKGGEG
jgi:hypothetical protein